MDREEIIRMALEAGIYHEYDSEGHWDGLTNEALIGKDWIRSKEHKLDRIVEILSPFAALVAAAEREACARLCDQMFHDWCNQEFEDEGEAYRNKPDAEDCKKAIRERGNT